MTQPNMPPVEVERLIEILRASDLGIAEFRAMQPHVAVVLCQLKARVAELEEEGQAAMRDANNEKEQLTFRVAALELGTEHGRLVRTLEERVAELEAVRMAADTCVDALRDLAGDSHAAYIQAYDAARAAQEVTP